MDYFDPFADPAATARERCGGAETRFLVLSFDTDWRFDTEHSREIVRELAARARARSRSARSPSPHGHDSFLLPVPEYHRTVRTFVDRDGATARDGAGAREPAALMRPDLDLVARLVPRARACSTSAAATARCSST